MNGKTTEQVNRDKKHEYPIEIINENQSIFITNSIHMSIESSGNLIEKNNTPNSVNTYCSLFSSHISRIHPFTLPPTVPASVSVYLYLCKRQTYKHLIEYIVYTVQYKRIYMFYIYIYNIQQRIQNTASRALVILFITSLLVKFYIKVGGFAKIKGVLMRMCALKVT